MYKGFALLILSHFCSNIEKKVADQIARTCWLVCAFVVRMRQQNLLISFCDEAQFKHAISLQIY